MSHSVWATFSYWFDDVIFESFHEHRTRYRASLVNPILFYTYAFSKHLRIFIPSPPMHFPAYSFVVQSTFKCPIVTSYYMTHIINAWWPTMPLLCSACSTRPRKKIAKNSKFHKKIFKKPKNPSKNFLTIRLASD